MVGDAFEFEQYGREGLADLVVELLRDAVALGLLCGQGRAALVARSVSRRSSIELKVVISSATSP